MNITLKPTLWNKLLETIVKKPNEFGLNKNSDKKNFIIEFVSANPTGPLHVGHCRGAILGDVVSNILKFNKHKVFKEYYLSVAQFSIFIIIKVIFV